LTYFRKEREREREREWERERKRKRERDGVSSNSSPDWLYGLDKVSKPTPPPPPPQQQQPKAQDRLLQIDWRGNLLPVQQQQQQQQSGATEKREAATSEWGLGGSISSISLGARPIHVERRPDFVNITPQSKQAFAINWNKN
jgi:hypothetical protein